MGINKKKGIKSVDMRYSRRHKEIAKKYRRYIYIYVNIKGNIAF